MLLFFFWLFRNFVTDSHFVPLTGQFVPLTATLYR
jgi:hypothetical protein